MRGKSRGFGSTEKETLALHLQGCDSSAALLGNEMHRESLRKISEAAGETQASPVVIIVCRFV